MKCWTRDTPTRPKLRKEPRRAGNGTATFADKAGMERAADNMVKLTPEWDGPAKVVETEG